MQDVYNNILNGKYENKIPYNKETRTEYHDEWSKLEDMFRNDLFEEFNVMDSPKKNECYRLAWEQGHSSGLYSVYNYFSDFVVLIK